jgi:hypothetical protein
MRRSAVFLDSFLDGFTLAGFLRPLQRPGAATQMFADDDASADVDPVLEHAGGTVMQQILDLQAKQAMLQAEIQVQADANRILRREVELLKSAGKSEYGSPR